MKKLSQKNVQLIIALISGFLVSYPVVCRWFGFFQKPLSEKIVLISAAWGLSAAVIWLLIRAKNNSLTDWRGKRHVTGIAAALAGSILILMIFNWKPPVFPSSFKLNISPSGDVQLIQARAGKDSIPFDQFSAASGWVLTQNGLIHTGSHSDNLQFSGPANAPLELVFASGPQSGSVIINLAGSTTYINLRTPLADYAVFNPIPAALGLPSILWKFWVGLLATTEWLLLAGFFYLIFSRWAAASTAFLFPLLFLLPYITTFAGHNVTLGNDFGPFYYVYKTYLLDFLSNGRFPLWSPSEGAGFPFFSNPLAQAVYPPNLILSLAYWINQGYTKLDHQVFTVLAVCWFSLGLYLWLRSLRVEKRFAVFAALTMALSYKMMELLRFPNAAHEAAWYPWILLCLTRLFISRNNKTTVGWAAVLFASLVCFLTAGYPYYVYYLPFLAAPFLVFMLIPRLQSTIFGIQKPDWRRFLTSAFIASTLAVLVCAPYLYQMGRTISKTAGRAGGDFEHATMYPFDFQDSIDSLVYPPAARPEGWFYFGAIGVLLIALFIAHSKADSSPGEDPVLANHRSWPVKSALLLWLGFLSYISYGEQSYLYLLFYAILPEFSALRGWGRLSIALLPGFALLLAYSMMDFESRLASAKKNRLANPQIWVPLTLATLAALIYQLVCLNRNIIDEYWSLFFIPRTGYLLQTIANTLGRDFNPDPAALSHWFSLAFIIFGLLAAAILAGLVWKVRLKTGSSTHWTLFICLGLFSAVNLWFGGPWLWNNGFSTRGIRSPGNYQRMTSIGISTPRKNENSTLTLSPSFSVGSPPKWHYGRYQEFYFQAAAESDARDILMGVKDGRRFFFSKSIHETTITGFLADNNQMEIKPVVHDYTGDYLLVEVTVPGEGYFSFIDNWDEDWQAQVDGKPVGIDKLFGVFKSVRLEAGRHEISMAYCPRFFEWVNSGCSLINNH